MSDKKGPWAGDIYVVMQFGLTIAGCIVFCLFVGRYLDSWLGTKGLFTIIFILLGIAGGANVAYRQIQKVLLEGQRKDDDSNGE
ncbi:MAG: AtpZ/AtpI family protein [Desulfatitalea sp.]|nr:AtpZ/AtpI family protein [Desulfatitalea sp.]NNJ98817.1 AtpZ/AtpI family protein [Desulfatitalea sp.]